MNPAVFVQLTCIHKPSATDITLMPLSVFLAVRSFMHWPCSRFHKRLRAELTSICSLSQVSLDVELQICFSNESLITHRACVRSVFYMFLHMCVEGIHGRYILMTDWAWGVLSLTYWCYTSAAPYQVGEPCCQSGQTFWASICLFYLALPCKTIRVCCY